MTDTKYISPTAPYKRYYLYKKLLDNEVFCKEFKQNLEHNKFMEKWSENILYKELMKNNDFRKEFFKQLEYDKYVKENKRFLDKEKINDIRYIKRKYTSKRVEDIVCIPLVLSFILAGILLFVMFFTFIWSGDDGMSALKVEFIIFCVCLSIGFISLIIDCIFNPSNFDMDIDGIGDFIGNILGLFAFFFMMDKFTGKK
ncbi:MAG: hypothetical protein IJ180_00150 [Bacteroidales bacterium]|nr:hypothetical protein [Bacteroidales bacterium]